jgi:hypothetical protein
VGSVETEARRGCGGAARRSGRRWRPDRGGGGGVELRTRLAMAAVGGGGVGVTPEPEEAVVGRGAGPSYLRPSFFHFWDAIPRSRTYDCE